MNLLWKFAVTAAGAGLAGYLVSRRADDYTFRGRVVVVSGGSRGLGFAFARRLVIEGARVVLLARDAGELNRARDELQRRGGDVGVYPCDVTSLESTAAAFARIDEDYGRIDVLINNAGVILSAPFEHHRDSDFEQAWRTHVMGPLHTIRAALPLMRRRLGGRILNISSIGGKIGVPHMSAYCASKFGLVGLSHSIAPELRREGIHITVACPGLMRTGSHRAAAFRGRQQDEFTWFTTMAGSPVVSMSADYAARRMLEALRRRRTEIVLPLHWKLASLGAAMLPGAAVAANSVVDRFLPSPAPGARETRRGRELSPEGPPQAIVERLEAAAERLQQT